MKFPVLFRIFAVLNILAFFILGILAVLMLIEPSKWGMGMIWVQWSVTIWLFASAIAWFFAGKASYHFLYSLGVMLLVVCSYWAWFIWASELSANINKSDKIMVSLFPGVVFMYIVFLVVALFYGPVVQWTEKRFSIKHAGIALGLFLLVGGGVFTYAAISKKPVSISAYITYPDSDDVSSVRSTIPGTESVLISFTNIETVTGLTLSKKDAKLDSETIHFAKVLYTDSTEINPLKAPFIVVEFKEDGEQLVAELPRIQARYIQIYPLSENKQTPSEKISYFCDGFSAVRFISAFDREEAYTSSEYVSEADKYETPEADPSTEQQPDVNNGNRISDETIHDFYYTFFANTYFPDQSDYSFDFSGYTIDVEEGKRLGMYKRGLSYIKPDLYEAVKKFQGYSNYDYGTYFYALTGFEVYMSKARDYENENNGTAFNQLNPAVITWAEENLVPKTGEEVLGYTAQDFYNRVFMRMMRMAVLSRMHLRMNDFEGDAEAYRIASESDEASDDGEGGFYGPNWLNNRYRDVVLDDYSTEENWEGAPEFIGFWLRRKIDGTEDVCWRALYNVMKKYDPEWLDGAVGDYAMELEEGMTEVDSTSVN